MSKKYIIKEYNREQFLKDKNIAFYTIFDERMYGFEYLVCILDREHFIAEDAIRAFVRFIRKHYILHQDYMYVRGINTSFCVGQCIMDDRFIKVG